MLCRFANRLSRLIILFFFFFSFIFFFFFFSYSSSSFCDTLHSEDDERDGRTGEVIIRWENDNRRSVAEDAGSSNSSMVLAPQRTLRKDPIDNFNLYRGGWNISDHHYWTSVVFTAAPFFITAGVWFAVFGIALLLTCLCFCCYNQRPNGYSRVCYAVSLTSLILFTIGAILGCIFLYSGQGRFHDSTSSILQYVVNQAVYIVGNLTTVSQSLSEAKNIGVDKATLPEGMLAEINYIQTKLDTTKKFISEQVDKTAKMIKKYLNQARTCLIILSAVMLLLAFVGFLLSIFGMECLVYTLVVFGWLLVTLTFILCGGFLIIHNVVADTCVAMGEWVENPTAHTALDDILPCVEKSTAQGTLNEAQMVTNMIVGMVDVGIATIANEKELINYNQSGPSLPLLCTPFNKDLTNRTCDQSEVELSNASEMLKKYTCEAKEVEGNEVCVTSGRLTPMMYTQMNAAVNVSYSLYLYTPYLVGIVDCTFVRNTFRDINKNNCPDLEKYTDWIYNGLLMVSAAIMLSLIFWVIYARERRHRVYTKTNNVSMFK